MNTCRPLLTVFIALTFISVGCDTESTDNGPTPVCVSVAGVWDVALVGETGTGITCPDTNLVWTIDQSGCDVTIGGAANGATGGVADNRLYVDWTWFESCYRYQESIDVTVDGDTMTGKYYLVRGQAVYPAYCPGLGICSATLNGVRRAAAR